MEAFTATAVQLPASLHRVHRLIAHVIGQSKPLLQRHVCIEEEKQLGFESGYEFYEFGMLLTDSICIPSY